jgi:opacity protein-like surface antigen
MKAALRIALAGATVLLPAGVVRAADLPAAPPVIVQQPMMPVQEFESWYLRGDIGMTNQKVKSIDNALFASTAGLVFLDDPSFGTGMLMGLGIGYQYNWARFDITGEYRGKTQFHALDRYTGGANDYTAKKSEWLFLANAYADLGTWWCFTPFIGFGIGAVDITISNFRDINVPNNGVAFGQTASKWNFAWALHAGASYKVTNNFVFEFAYRYLSLGDAQSGDLTTYLGGNAVYNPMIFKDITSHDFKFGFRWALVDFDASRRPAYAPVYTPPPPQVAPAPHPVYTQPAPVYAPPPAPTYSQPPAYSLPPQYPQQYSPPLSRRG